MSRSPKRRSGTLKRAKLFELKGQADWVTRVSFSSDGTHRYRQTRQAVEGLGRQDGSELPGEAIPKTDFSEQLSRDGRFWPRCIAIVSS